MAQNVYDDEKFFLAYSGLRRSIEGLDGAPEWPTLRSMLPPLSGSRVVDLGCGFGWFSRWAATNRAVSVLGIDLSERMLARAALDTHDDTITFRRADLDTIDLAPAAFDVAYSSLTMHYLEDLDRFVRTIQQSLAEGGSFVFSVEHPIYTAPSRPQFVTDSSGRVTWPLDQYLVEGPRTTNWLAPGVVKHHRTITTYLSCLQDAGFVLEHFDEWAPTAAQIADHPEWAVELERPQFLLIGARRR